MKRTLTMLCALTMALSLGAQTYVERLSRGVVALPAGKGNFISWRLLSTDAPSTTFNLMRDGDMIAEGLSTVTNFTDTLGTPQSHYSVQTVVNGSIAETSDEVAPWDKPYISMPLLRPTDDVTPDGRSYSYTPNDCSVGDIDGDGDYEIFLKWDPSNSRDNSHDGYTGNVYIDCYKMGGILVWRVDLGKNIRAGAHYTQFMVYDLDGDGKAEMVCKTAPGSKDGKGDYVTLAATDKEIRIADNEADYRGEDGHVLEGPEYLTVFSGKDGHAIHTIFYQPNRGLGVGGAPEYARIEWGDNHHGNRGERFLACVAFLDGKDKNPSAVMCRGYYTMSYLWAVDFDGKELKTHWLYKGTEPHTSAYGQGAHSIAVGDVDGDGCDEITYGSAAINNDGTLLYTTDLGHGDAQHLADLDPDRPGLEYYMVLETRPYGSNYRDARTGEILFRKEDIGDTGRGLAADIDPDHRGYEFWCSAEKKVYNVDGTMIAETEGWTPQNFRIYWDGDLQDELIGNGSRGSKPGGEGKNSPRQRNNRGNRNGGWNGGNDGGGSGMQGFGQDGGNGGEGFGGGDFGGFGQRGQRGMGQRMRNRGEVPDSIRARFAEARQRMQGQQRPQRYYVAKWNGSGTDDIFTFSDYGNSASCNGTKATPCLQADLFGDWREEIILYDASDRSHLNIFTTNIPTQYRVPTLMHDHIYRMGVVWQNVSYNQPPHLGYYLPDLFK